MKKQQEKKSSMVLGILSIIFGVLIPIVGVVLSIVGLSIKKSVKHYNRDLTLNIVGLIVSLLAWIFSFLWLMGY